MKILHISTYDKGGAGIAAVRLHNSLIENGIDSNILFLYQGDFNINKSFLYPRDRSELTIIQRFINKFKSLLFKSHKKITEYHEVKGDFEIFSFPTTKYKVEDLSIVEDSDIINLHWVSNFINYETFFNKIKKPIIWTLHDMNPFLGGFHYSIDRLKNKHLIKLDTEFRQYKERFYKENKEIQIVALCDWMKKKLQSENAFIERNIVTIPNSIDFDKFKPINKAFAKEVFDIPKNDKIILFVSQNIHTYRKGIDILVDALENIELPIDYKIVAIGNTINENKHSKITYIDHIYDERLMNLAYNIAEVFILPSREDNLPNTMLECMACGIPIISFNNGGMKNHISDENGILLDTISSESISKGIQEYLEKKDSFNSKIIREIAISKFNKSKQVSSYLTLYKNSFKNIKN